MSELSYYQEYAQLALEQFAERTEESRDLMVNAVKDKDVRRVLDVGCGAGQELLPFVHRKNSFCVGIDVGEELGIVGRAFAKQANSEERLCYTRSKGEELPFADESFDVVLCRVALPYMNNRRAIAEVSRVLRPDGVFLLKTHSPVFYLGLLFERIKTLSPRQIAYPLICLAKGAWFRFTGRQLETGIWTDKEVFQTKRFLEKEFEKCSLEFTDILPDTNIQTPSYLITKI